MLGGAWFQGPCTWTGCIFSAEAAGGPGGTCRLWWQRGYGRRWWREATGKRDKEVEDTGALYSPSAPVPPLLSLLESASNKSYRGIRGGRRGSFLHLLLTFPVLPLIFQGRSRGRGVVVGRWKCCFVASSIVICRCSVGVSPSWHLPRWFKVEPPQARRSGSAPWQEWSAPAAVSASILFFISGGYPHHSSQHLLSLDFCLNQASILKLSGFQGTHNQFSDSLEALSFMVKGQKALFSSW